MAFSVRPEVAVTVLAVCALGATFLPARGGSAGASGAQSGRAPKGKIALVFDVGGRGDKSFNDAAYAGLSRAERELSIDAQYLEPSGAEDREAGLRLFAARGYDLVVAVGFIFSSDVNQVAREYPNVHFACVDYAPGAGGPPSNVVGLVFKEEEGSFLVGAVAGGLSKTKHVGFVGGMTIPLIRKFEAGYMEGVKAACPECAVHSAYAGSTPDAFRDPAKGKALAISQIALGADVIFHASGSTGHGVFEACHDAQVKAIGVDSDQFDDMPDTVVTSMVKRADVAVFNAIRDAIEGRFAGGMRVFGLKESGVDYVHVGPHAALLSPSVIGRVEVLRAEVVAGARHVPDR
jgi:basic membrane protein A